MVGGVFSVSQPIHAGARIRIWVGAIFMVPSEQILERQILTRVTFAPVLGFNRFRLGFPNPNKSAGINRLSAALNSGFCVRLLHGFFVRLLRAASSGGFYIASRFLLLMHLMEFRISIHNGLALR